MDTTITKIKRRITNAYNKARALLTYLLTKQVFRENVAMNLNW